MDEVVTIEDRLKAAEDMLRSQAYDNFLATKFQSVKRYGGEGAESMIVFFTEVFKNIAKGKSYSSVRLRMERPFEKKPFLMKVCHSFSLPLSRSSEMHSVMVLVK